MKKNSLIFAEFIIKFSIVATFLIVVALTFLPVTVAVVVLYGLGRLLDAVIRERVHMRYERLNQGREASTFGVVKQYAERLPSGAVFRTSNVYRSRARELGCEITDNPRQGSSIDIVEFRKL